MKADHRYGGLACASRRPEKKKKGKNNKGKGVIPPFPLEKIPVGKTAPPTSEPSSNPEPIVGSVGSQEEAMDTIE